MSNKSKSTSVGWLRMLMLCAFSLVIIAFSSKSTLAQAKSTLEVSILTSGPGPQIYALFGHTALRVRDAQSGADHVYNFGTFDEDTDGFYLKFLAGTLYYQLTRTTYQDYMAEYIADNRWVFEQQLLVDQVELQLMADSLQTLLLPENRDYLYDFFTNNCSTRVFDLVLYYSKSGSVPDTLLQAAAITWRKALKPYIAGYEWLNVGINLLLGPFADQPMTLLQSTFLPENLMHVAAGVGVATLPQSVFEGTFTPPAPLEPNVPMILLWALLLLMVADVFIMKSSSRRSDIIDITLYATSAALGLLLLALWLWSRHIPLLVNLNLLWANPLNVLVVWSIATRRKLLTRIWLIIYLVPLSFMIINWTRMPQVFPLELMPLVTLLAFRTVNRLFRFRQKEAATAKEHLNETVVEE
ncbi:MAG: DUF4105 domain-containing protein [Clostridia bacterium]|nr:DUF4105 domain-containing protein [Clostridia bacterium]